MGHLLLSKFSSKQRFSLCKNAVERVHRLFFTRFNPRKSDCSKVIKNAVAI